MSSITSVPGNPPMVQVPVSVGPRPAPMGNQAQTLNVQDILRVLKRHVVLIILVFIAVMMLTVVGTFIWAKWFPSYKAYALVEVKTPTPPPAMGMEQRLANKDIIMQYMNTQANLIRSLGTLSAALQDPEIKQTSWYKSFVEQGRININEALVDMRERFSAVPIRDTWYIQVGFSWRNPTEAATIVNVVLDTYFQDVSRASKSKTRNELRQYENRAQELRDELERKVAQQERFRTARNIPLLEQRRARIGDRVTALTQLLAEAQTQKDQAQAMYEMYNQPGAQQRIAGTPEMRQLVESDFLIRTYTAQLADLQVQLSTAKEKGPNNRVVSELEARIKAIQKKLNQKKAQLISDNFRDMRERTKVELDTINNQIIGLRTRLAEAKLELSDLEAQLAKYLATEKEIDNLRKQLEKIEDYILQLRIQLDNPELVRVSIASRAVRPLERSSPKWIINLPAGFVLGIMLGVGLAFLIEFLPTTVKTSADVVRQLNLPVLGQIPSQDDDEASAEDMHKLLIESPHSIIAESFRQLRANFMFSAPADQQKTVLITSCAPSEGKTCITVNLGTSLALIGKKVLLVDANFHRPGIAQALNIKNTERGLTNILVGEANAEELIQNSGLENLDVLPAGPLPPNSAELLSKGYLKDFINQYSQKYDTILFDGPPLLVLSDSLILSTAVDGVIMVIRAGISARGAIMRAREQLRRANAKLLGIVLNDVKASRGGYFKEMYRTYYEYQQTALPEAEKGESNENQENTSNSDNDNA